MDVRRVALLRGRRGRLLGEAGSGRRNSGDVTWATDLRRRLLREGLSASRWSIGCWRKIPFPARTAGSSRGGCEGGIAVHTGSPRTPGGAQKARPTAHKEIFLPRRGCGGMASAFEGRRLRPRDSSPRRAGQAAGGTRGSSRRDPCVQKGAGGTHNDVAYGSRRRHKAR